MIICPFDLRVLYCISFVFSLLPFPPFTPPLQESKQTDASGNRKLEDIGLAVKDFVGKHMKSLGLDHTVKYVDPAYIIRSSQANTSDALYCIHLAQVKNERKKEKKTFSHPPL